MQKEEFVSLLKNNKAKITPTRLRLFKQLQKLSHASNAYEILEQDQQSTIDITTIYRNLELFESLGIVHHIHNPEGYILCDHQHTQCKSHDLIICQKCNTIQETHIETSIKQTLGLESGMMKIYGKCTLCK